MATTTTTTTTTTRTPYTDLIRLRQYRQLQAASQQVCSNGMGRRMRQYLQELLAQHGWTLDELAHARRNNGHNDGPVV